MTNLSGSVVMRPASQSPATGTPIQTSALPSTITTASAATAYALAPAVRCPSWLHNARVHLITEISGWVASSVCVKT